LKDKDFISNADKIRELSKAYSKDDEKSKKLFGGNKANLEKIDTFGNAQNRFNSNVCRALDDTNTSFQELCDKINTLETKLATVVQQNDSLKSRINALQKNDVMVIDSCIKACAENTTLINNYVRKINPTLRDNVNYDGKKEISINTLNDALAFGKEKNLNDIDFNAWSTYYKNILRGELHNISIDGAKNIVTVLCKGALKSFKDANAHNNAFDVYKTLKRSSIYNIKFVSIEDSLEHPIFDGDFICVPSVGAGTYVSVIESALCVLCNDSLDILNDYSELLTQKTIFKLTQEDCFDGLNKDFLEELRYFNDLGIHKYLISSSEVGNMLVKNGLHEATTFSESSFVDVVETFLEESTVKNVITLKDWKDALKKSNKSLAISNQDVIKYHKEHDFNTYASKIFNFMELQNVGLILEDRFDNNKNLNTLDISCGDGRITQECLTYGKCTAIDTNIDYIKDKVKGADVSKLDYISDDVKGSFDAITCFRFINHFDYATRKTIYKKILSNLKDNGIFIMDVPSVTFESSNKKVWQDCELYQKCWTKQSITEELKANGFKIRYIIPTGEDLNNPITWTIGAIKNY